MCQGQDGKSFAKKAATRFGAKITGHTHYIGINQPGKVSVDPGADPTWGDDDGTDAWIDEVGFVHEKGRKERNQKGAKKVKEAQLPKNTEGEKTHDSKKGVKKDPIPDKKVK